MSLRSAMGVGARRRTTVVCFATPCWRACGRNLPSIAAEATRFAACSTIRHQEAAYLRLMAVGSRRRAIFMPRGCLAKPSTRTATARGLEAVDNCALSAATAGFGARCSRSTLSRPQPAREEIDKLARERLAAAAAQSKPDEGLQRFLDDFGGIPLADQARTLLVPKLRQQKRLLEAEMVLRRLERTGDLSQAGTCLAELAAMLREEGLAEDAAVCYAKAGQGLRRRALPRDRVGVVRGADGRELLAALPADDPVRKFLKPAAPWPSGSATYETTADAKAARPHHGDGRGAAGVE